jgi:hypothetical protein
MLDRFLHKNRTGNAGQDGTLLDGGRLLETVTIDAAKQLGVQVHVVEALDNLVPSRLKKKSDNQIHMLN